MTIPTDTVLPYDQRTDPNTPFTIIRIEGPVDLHIPTAVASKITVAADTLLNSKLTPGQKTQDYIESLVDASKLSTVDDCLNTTDKSTWDTSINIDGTRFKSYLHEPSVVQGQKVTGQAAVIRAQSRSGGGGVAPTVLPHSGLWVTFLPPGEGEMLNLWTVMASDKISLGRYTYGAIFSATSIVTQRRILEFCRTQIKATTVNLTSNKLNILDMILVTDIPLFLNGMGICMYPRGVKYRAACVADPATCQELTEGTLNPVKLQRYDWVRIPEDVRVMLASTSKDSTSVESVLNYQARTNGTGKAITIKNEEGDAFVFHVKVPSIQRALTMGSAWVDQLHDAVVRSLTLENDQVGQEEMWTLRDDHITRHGQASFLAQYAPWITCIDMLESGIVDEDADIIAVLIALSTSDVLRKRLIEELNKFFEESTLAIVGIPLHSCPSCGRDSVDQTHTLITVDPVRLFFKYLVARTNRVTQRSMK